MGRMNGYHQVQRQFSAEDMQRMAHLNNQDAMMGLMGPNGMNASGMVRGQSLDEMIHQNDKEIQRRRSFHHSQPYGYNRSMHCEDLRRSSMLEFGSGNNSDLDGFQFDPAPAHPSPSMQRPGNIAQRRLDNHRLRRQMSNESMALNTNYSTMPSSYSSITTSSPYGQPLTSADPLSGFDMSNEYIAHNFLGMDFTNTPMDNGVSNDEITPRDAFSPTGFPPPINQSQLQQNMSPSIDSRLHDPGGGGVASNMGVTDMMTKVPNMPVSDQMQTSHTSLSPPNSIPMPMSNPGMPVSNPDMTTALSGPHGLPIYDPAGNPQASANLDISTDANGMPFQGQNSASQQVIPQYRNAYSSSGFDMLGVLMRVAARPKPQINIGAVDMSCAFVVCDVTQHDVPIVYCSDVFERLTAYTRHEILGRNCRFLQAPDGKIQAGVKRKYVDDQAVFRIKNMITRRQETQISVINYRKGGQPFMNLLTMIPITWDTDEFKYYVGFQVDLVEQPTSITNKNPGMFKICVLREVI